MSTEGRTAAGTVWGFRLVRSVRMVSLERHGWLAGWFRYGWRGMDFELSLSARRWRIEIRIATPLFALQLLPDVLFRGQLRGVLPSD